MGKEIKKSRDRFIRACVLMGFSLVVFVWTYLVYDPGVPLKGSPQIRIRSITAEAEKPKTPPKLESKPQRSAKVEINKEKSKPTAKRDYVAEGATPERNKNDYSWLMDPPEEDKTIATENYSDPVRKASHLVDLGQFEQAIPVLEEVLQADPQNERALVELGMVYLIDKDEPMVAQQYLEKAFKLNPANKAVMTELVDIYEETGQQDRGADYLKSIYQDRPEDSQIAMRISQLSRQDGPAGGGYSVPKSSEAMLNYVDEGAVSSELTSSPEAHAQAADSYVRSGNEELAVDQYRESIKLEQEKIASGSYEGKGDVGEEHIAEAQMEIVASLMKQNKKDEAEKEFKKVREILKTEERFNQFIEKSGYKEGSMK